MAGVKVGNLDIQFQATWDPVKANQLVQTLQQVVSALSTLANASSSASATPATPVSQVLATQTGLGKYLTVAGLTAGQVLIAESPSTAHFAALSFAQLADTDPLTFAAPANGSVIGFVNGYWSAVANSLGLENPGSDALVMWDANADAGAGGTAWALAGAGIKLTSGSIAVDPTEINHNELADLSQGNPHPQYALVAETPQLDLLNTFTVPQVFETGLSSLSDLALGGNLEQDGPAGVEQRVTNNDDISDEGTWRLHIEPGQELHASVSDPDPGYPIGADGECWLYIQRSGELVDTIGLQAQYLTFNGFDVCCGELLPGAGPMSPSIAGYLTITVGGQTIKVPYLSS